MREMRKQGIRKEWKDIYVFLFLYLNKGNKQDSEDIAIVGIKLDKKEYERIKEKIKEADIIELDEIRALYYKN
jgi:glutamate formiminotransferase